MNTHPWTEIFAYRCMIQLWLIHYGISYGLSDEEVNSCDFLGQRGSNPCSLCLVVVSPNELIKKA